MTEETKIWHLGYDGAYGLFNKKPKLRETKGSLGQTDFKGWLPNEKDPKASGLSIPKNIWHRIAPHMNLEITNQLFSIIDLIVEPRPQGIRVHVEKRHMAMIAPKYFKEEASWLVAQTDEAFCWISALQGEPKEKISKHIMSSSQLMGCLCIEGWREIMHLTDDKKVWILKFLPKKDGFKIVAS